MSQPKVTIVTPTYNRASSIGRSIQSVLAQTYSNFEYIIVDDGSTDETESIVKSFSDHRISYHRLSHNQGQSAAMNAGARLASGSLITFLDSDDEYYPTRIEKQVRVFQESTLENLGIVTCGRTDINHRGEEYFSWVPKLRGNLLIPMLAGDRVGGGPPFLMIKREIFDGGIFFDEKLKSVKEADFLIQAYLKGYTTDFVAEPLLKVYHDANQRTFNYKNGTITRMILFRRYPDVFTPLPLARKFLYRTLLYSMLTKDETLIADVQSALRERGEFIKPRLWRVIQIIPTGSIQNAVIKVLNFLSQR